MANDRTLTSANAIFTLVVPGLFDTPTRIQGFAADNVIDTDAVANAEISLGVDGRLSAAYLHKEVPQKIHLQADSESVDLFDAWYRAQQNAQTVFFASGEITLLATGKSYDLVRGVMVKFKSIPDIKKKLEAQEVDLVWESISPNPV